MNKNEYSILTFFITRCLYAGIAIHNICFIAKQDSWLSIILAFIVGLVPFSIYIKLLNKEPNLNIQQMLNKHLGKLGYILNILLIIIVTIDASIILWNLSNFVNSQFLFKTPIYIIAIFFMIPVIYTINKGINAIGRTAVILFIIDMLMYVTCFVTLIFKIDLNNMLPIFEDTSILGGALIELSYNIISIFILLSIPKNNIKDYSTKTLIYFYVFNFLTAFLVIFFIIGIFDANMTNLYQYPEFHILKTINIANFFQRVESILAFQWLIDFIMGLILFIYFIKTSIIEITKYKNDNIIYIIGIIIIVLSLSMFKNNTVAYNFLGNIYKYIRLLVFIIPALCLKN